MRKQCLDDKTKRIDVARDIGALAVCQFGSSEGFGAAGGFVYIGVAVGVAEVY